MMPCHSCYIYGIRKNRGGGGVLKSSYGGGHFLWGELTPLDTMVYFNHKVTRIYWYSLD